MKNIIVVQDNILTDSELHITNTLTRKKDIFKPIEQNKVKMFTCGPSIYRRPHIGNYRTFLYEDILQRYMEYIDYEVERVINFTDIEDKSISEAKVRGTTLEKVTNPVAERFYKEAELLKIKLPSFVPRSSSSVDQAVKLIKILVEKGYAYWHGKDVFYDPLKFSGFGKLSGLDMSRWPNQKIRFRKDTYKGQRWNLGDFILWHGYRKGDDTNFYWETEFGMGRPSWNIDDPAIITKHLGYEIDVSCGGVDNLCRHHDYNISVIEAVSGKKFARYWLHGEHLLINGSKMSKSKGNITYLENLLTSGYSPGHIRFYLIYGHYREKMNLTLKKLERTSRKLDSFKKMVEKIINPGSHIKQSHRSADGLINGLREAFEQNMNDDLNLKGAFDAAYRNVTQLMTLKMNSKLTDHDSRRLKNLLIKIDEVLQVIYV